MTTESGELPAAAPSSTAALVDALAAVRQAAAELHFALPVPGAERAADVCTELVRQLDDYLLPRLRRLDAPLLAVVGGSTGAGKSTLVNTLVRRAGQPGRRAPADHPLAGAGLPSGRPALVLRRPGAARAGPVPGRPRASAPQPCRWSARPAVQPGLALLDAPDIDSVVAGNRELAGQLLAAADLWVFVTTAARYADAVPWDLLHTAEQRGTALAVVLNRVPPGRRPRSARTCRRCCADNELSRAPLFVVPEVAAGRRPAPGRRGRPAAGLAASGWPRTPRRGPRWSADPGRRAAQRGARGCRRWPPQADEQLDAAQRAARAGRAPRTRTAPGAVDDGIRDGTLLRGEVLARWQEFVGTGELLRTLQARVGPAAGPDHRRVHRPAAARTRSCHAALESSVESLVRAAAAARPRADRGRLAGPRRPAPGCSVRTSARSARSPPASGSPLETRCAPGRAAC